jgi:hypothetical protein
MGIGVLLVLYASPKKPPLIMDYDQLTVFLNDTFYGLLAMFVLCAVLLLIFKKAKQKTLILLIILASCLTANTINCSKILSLLISCRLKVVFHEPILSFPNGLTLFFLSLTLGSVLLGELVRQDALGRFPLSRLGPLMYAGCTSR